MFAKSVRMHKAICDRPVRVIHHRSRLNDVAYRTLCQQKDEAELDHRILLIRRAATALLDRVDAEGNWRLLKQGGKSAPAQAAAQVLRRRDQSRRRYNRLEAALSRGAGLPRRKVYEVMSRGWSFTPAELCDNL